MTNLAAGYLLLNQKPRFISTAFEWERRWSARFRVFWLEAGHERGTESAQCWLWYWSPPSADNPRWFVTCLRCSFGWSCLQRAVWVTTNAAASQASVGSAARHLGLSPAPCRDAAPCAPVKYRLPVICACLPAHACLLGFLISPPSCKGLCIEAGIWRGLGLQPAF